MLNKTKSPEKAGTDLVDDKKAHESNAAHDNDNLWKRSTIPNFFKEVPIWDLFLEKVAKSQANKITFLDCSLENFYFIIFR